MFISTQIGLNVYIFSLFFIVLMKQASYADTYGFIRQRT